MILLMMDHQDGGHDGVAVCSDSPAMRAWNFGDEGLGVQKLEQSAGTMTLSMVFKIVGRRFVELLANVGVAKALKTVFAPYHSSQQINLVFARRVQSTMAASFCASSSADTLNLLLEFSGVRRDRQCIQITSIGRHADFPITRHVAHAFTHWKPVRHNFALSFSRSTHFKFTRIVDHCLDSQYAPEFVLHFHPVLFRRWLRRFLHTVILCFTRAPGKRFFFMSVRTSPSKRP